MAWYNVSWGFRKKITIDKDKVNATLSNFPVIINLASDNDIKDEALASANDILFTSSDGTTKLKHEIQRYTTGTGELIAWVKIPSLSSSADTDIYIYYGNAGAADQSDAENVWDANYKMIQHMKDNTTSSTLDSTANNHDGTKLAENSPVVNTSGKIGSCQQFDGFNDEIIVTDHADLDLSGNFTIEAWLNYVDISAGGVFISKFWDGSTRAYDAGITASGQLTLLIRPAGDGADTIVYSADGVITTGTWYHVVMLYDGTNYQWYVDGVASGSAVTKANPDTNNADLNIGDRSHPSSNVYMDGKIDEVRISSTNRAVTLLTTQHNNQNNPGTFYSLGAEETSGPAIGVTAEYLPILTPTIDTAITNARTGANNKYFNVPIVNDVQIMFIHISQ